jgi:hypothetical protein
MKRTTEGTDGSDTALGGPLEGDLSGGFAVLGTNGNQHLIGQDSGVAGLLEVTRAQWGVTLHLPQPIKRDQGGKEQDSTRRLTTMPRLAQKSNSGFWWRNGCSST